MTAADHVPELSVVAPAHNEEDNLRPLVREITDALQAADLDHEIVVVDDGSTDGTARLLVELMGEFPSLRAITRADTPPGRGNGQSAAFHAGFRVAQGRLIAVLDADLQNDPADIPLLVEKLEQGYDLVCGWRRERKDPLSKRVPAISISPSTM